MAVSSQLTRGTQKKNVPTTFSSFMTSPLVVKKVNEMVGGKMGKDLLHQSLVRCLQILHYKSVILTQSYQVQC